MVIEKILKQLTPERIKKEIEAIQKVKLPPELQKWVKEYEKVGERNEFIFLWLYRIVQIATLPIIAKEYQYSLWRIKFLIAMFIILLDDVADKTRKKRLLNELLKIPLRESSFKINLLSQKEQKYFNFTLKVWTYIKKTVAEYPRYKEFREICEFDIAQLLNTMRYAYLVNTIPFLINKTEYWLYSSYSEESVICFTLDLMCSPDFNIEDLRNIRELAWQAQKMTRIGDCLSTWERETKEGDLTNGIIAYAVSSGVLSVDELIKKEPLEIIEKIKDSQIEYCFFKKWEEAYREFNKLIKKNQILNTKEILLMPKKIITSQLSSKGRY